MIKPKQMLEWKIDGFPRAVQYAPEAIHPLIAQMEEAFRLQPWGGVETGGILLGKREPGVVHILACHEFPCDHEYGPSWELTPRELESLGKLVAEAGQTVVGWYRSASRHKDLFSLADQAVFDRFFPQDGMLALIVERTKGEPCRAILFGRHLETLPHADVPIH